MSSTLQIRFPLDPSFFSESQLPDAARPERRKEPRPEPRRPKHRGDAKTKTILIVDDQVGERKVIRAAVEGFTGCTVCGEAATGTEAIQKAKQLKPDLIIMDLAMPLMNGLEAASVLKNELPGVSVVLFTLYSDLVNGPRSSMFGVTMVLSKEDGLSPLLDCIKNLLGSS
jgi:DNA-binding NarL/FixJ family response regulator